MIVDCHVNIWEDEHVLPAVSTEQTSPRPPGRRHATCKADADTLYAAMAGVDRAIVFALGYGNSPGIESDDETTAAAMSKYPDKFVGFAYVDPRRAGYMEQLRHAIEELGLQGH